MQRSRLKCLIKSDDYPQKSRVVFFGYRNLSMSLDRAMNRDQAFILKEAFLVWR
ncbi:MAG: hypothetical protein H0A76_10465 [Candidatus Thiodubiliella endoseptemdiera]|uniref:Uncharacterized protein n=1 Tax=Candidatus Thiodubiliella endoseptemdiera TaxID=2738886 RepID=A0A853F3N3_9GAMM|nr:hypothetical protein [Candidatus Thiodubiliella endoseptemdiera]